MELNTKHLKDALMRCGAAAEDFGFGFTETLSLIALALEGTKKNGDFVGNSLKSIFVRFNRQESLDQLKIMGIETHDEEGWPVPAKELLSELADRFESVPLHQQIYFAENMVGPRNVKTLLAILNLLNLNNQTQ